METFSQKTPQSYAALFSPLTIKNMTIPNRVVMMPMGTNFALETGGISDSHIHYYEQRAQGGTGMIIVENVCVDFPLGSNGTTQLRMDHDRFLPGMARLCEAIHRHGSKAAIQLNHAGASAVFDRIGMHPVSASNLPSKPGGEPPVPMLEEQMKEIIWKFGEAAYRAKCAGFDAVELHAGHSYLLSQFLSPTTNIRTDTYGGCAENRARFPKLILEEIRRRVGHAFPLIVRISLDEFVPGGNTVENSLELMEHFCKEADLFSVSAGLNGSLQFQIDTANLPDGWRSYMARAVKERFGKPVITMGNIRDPKVAEEILERGDSDLIGIGRGLIAEPNWVNKVRNRQEQCLRHCISCNVGCAGNRIGLNRPIRCTVNPAVDIGEDYAQRQITKPCNVVVIGGGVAGLEAACTAAEVGCTVVLLERGKRLGGLTGSLSKIAGKFRMHHFVDYQLERASKLKNLFVLTGVDADVPFVERFHPDLVVNATGSQPLLPPIPGLEKQLHAPGTRLYTIKDIMKKTDITALNLTGKRVGIAGGGAAGLDAIEYFTKRGAKVFVVEREAELGFDSDPIARCNLHHNLEQYQVEQYTETELVAVTDHSFLVEQNGTSKELPYDYGYLCLGMRSDAPLLEALETTFRERGVPIYNIGDSAKARRMIDGVREGRNVLARLEELGFFR